MELEEFENQPEMGQKKFENQPENGQKKKIEY